jgi:CRP/FNR family cyclic AMP-dependent transcriptional regulator
MAINGKNTMSDVRAAIDELSMFNGVDEEALHELASMARSHDYPKNNILFYQGDPPGSIYLLINGRVKCTLMNEEGREVVLNVVRPGGIFGLISAMDGDAQPANAITVQRSRLAKFPVDDFVAWLAQQKMVQKVIMAEFGRRIREAYQKIGEHALMGVKERLLMALLDIAEREGEPVPGSEAIVFTRPTHQELANRIGSSREVVSRMLKDLLASDLLQAEGRVIRVSESALILRED